MRNGVHRSIYISSLLKNMSVITIFIFTNIIFRAFAAVELNSYNAILAPPKHKKTPTAVEPYLKILDELL